MDPGQHLPARKVSILVADDDHLNQLLMSFLMNVLHLTPDFCDNGQEVVTLLREKKYDIILMNLEMPLLNGYDATRIIRTEMRLTIPIIAISSYISYPYRKKAIDCGMNDYLEKPVDPARLLSILSRYL